VGRATAMIVVATVLGGCGSGTSLLHGSKVATSSTTTAKTRSTSADGTAAEYLAALEVEQQRLAGAEQRLPHKAPTSRALARAIVLLHTAIVRLAGGLGTLHPPSGVAQQHARLVSAMRLYAARLATAAREARARGGAPRAANELLAATDSASRSFTATIGQIDHRLAP
jgi:hypothetical protein